VAGVTAGQSRRAATAPTGRRARPDADRRVWDVLVVGGGPAGSACAYWLAEAGWDVAVVEKKVFPRVKTCGDGLTPRAVRQLADMGVESALVGAHRYRGLRAYGFGQSIELPWPEHPSFPNYGYTITRHDLDGLVSERATKAGATVWQGAEAVEPMAADGAVPHAPGVGPGPGSGVAPSSTGTRRSDLAPCAGATVRDTSTGEVRDVRARYVVVADGSNSRFGRALGASRDRGRPLGMALRGYYRSPGHNENFIESHLDIRDGEGAVVPGYGWIFPLGDGRVNVGVGVLSTDQRWKGINTTTLMDHFVNGAPAHWELSPESALGAPTGGKLPMGLAVGPRVGPNTVLVGDASGVINPFNGEGIAYGYETGRLAAAVLGEALSGGGPGALVDYDRRLEEAYGLYFRVARAFVRIISRPDVMRVCVGAGLHSESVMSWMLRIMANLLRPDETGPAEATYRALAVVSRLVPESV
jgi:geranylgeranyl reductase family protein